MIKRLFDISISFLALVILSPLLIIISVWVLLDSKGGFFYKQPRVGKGNRDFTLLKFRSMHPGADTKGLLTVGERDPRITGAGYYLRKTKLDELPQLINILAGDMSLVGPRPEVRKYVDLYTDEQLKVLDIRPGLTDNASLAYINESEILAKSEDPEKTYIETILPAKLELNLQYVREHSPGKDVGIIFRTIIGIFK